MCFLDNQTWVCGDNGHFRTEVPNRSECMEEWLPEVDDEVQDNTTYSIDNSKHLEGHLRNTNDKGISEKGIGKIAKTLGDIIAKRDREIEDEIDRVDQKSFVKSMLENIDMVLSNEQSWTRFEYEDDGIQNSTCYLLLVIDIGQQHLDSFDYPCKIFLSSCLTKLLFIKIQFFSEIQWQNNI